MGGIVKKFFPEADIFEQDEMERIIKAAIDSMDCKRVVSQIKAECNNKTNLGNHEPEKMYCEYTDETYYPEAKEDLVHAEVLLPGNTPKEFADRAVLWNAVENYEDRIDAQFARTTIINMPNDWSYELAIEVVRDYIQRNFVDYGMCADFCYSRFRKTCDSSAKSAFSFNAYYETI